MKDNNMLKQVLSIPKLIEEIYWKLEADSRLVVSTPEMFATKDIIIFGSGDSYVAALGASTAFAKLSNVNTTAMTSMQASRYVAGTYVSAPEKNILAIGISNSGGAARVVEAMSAFKKRGCRTLAVTANPESPMAKAADKILQVSAPEFVSSPGVRSYVVAQLTMYLLAIRFAEVKGLITMDKAGDYRRELYGYGNILKEAYEKNGDKLKKFSELCVEKEQIELLGSGPCRGAADFGAAKAIEATGITAVSQDVEEFAHINFFRKDPKNIPTVLMAPSDGKAIGRCVEIAQALKVLERPYLILTDNFGDCFGDHENNRICLEGVLKEIFAPVVLSCISAFIVASMDCGDDTEYYRGHKGPWSEKDFPDVKSSKIVF